MKKISFLLFIILAFNSFCMASYLDKQLKNSKKSSKYNSVKIYTQNDLNLSNSGKIKDPKLIKISNYTEISESVFKKKLEKDEKEYASQKTALKAKKESTSAKQPYSIDLYNLYRVAEKIIRANNLDYINWRIELYNDTKTFNAYTTSANLVTIYSGLYDSLYNNEDALAFIVSHELSHQILGHLQRKATLDKTLRRWVPEGERGTLDLIYYKKMRDIELEADSEAFELLARAGYSANNAMEAINFIEALPDYNTLFSSHPKAKQRRENAVEIAKYINPDWQKEGRYNLYKSNVLEAKRSSDKVSFIITGSNKDSTYELETYEKRLLRYAYISYLNGEYQNAVKYFEMLIKAEPKFEYYLYLSYANEELYNKTKKDKYLQDAIEAINSALSISNNKYVIEQANNLKGL